MRRLATTLLAAAALAGASAAPAAAQAPDATWVQWSLGVAQSYWHGAQPGCGRPTVKMGQVPAGEPANTMAWANYDTCTIAYRAGLDWSHAAQLCLITTHEYGHLVLGPRFYAATNPSDPAHDPDPNSVMNSTAAWGSVPGCTTRPPNARQRQIRVRRHVRGHWRWRWAGLGDVWGEPAYVPVRYQPLGGA